jgi:predicted molibdopterin-dependent oxidoreductase YjgC
VGRGARSRGRWHPRFHGPSTFGIFSCSKATNEVNYMAQKFIRSTIGSNNIDSCNRT